MPVVALYCCLTKSQYSVFHHDLFSGAYQTAGKMVLFKRYNISFKLYLYRAK